MTVLYCGLLGTYFYIAGVHGYIDKENYIALIYNEKLSYLHNTVFSIVRAYWAYSSEHI